MAEKTTLGINQKIGGEKAQYEELKKQIAFDTRCACPAIIQSVNYDEMTVSAKPCIKEKIQLGSLEVEEKEIPVIHDIPLCYPSTKGSSSSMLFFTVKAGDECILIFSDTCIDSWWQSGGIQSQFELRRHDLSDCFCIPCQMSQPRKIVKPQIPTWRYEEGVAIFNGWREITEGFVLKSGNNQISVESNEMQIYGNILINGYSS